MCNTRTHLNGIDVDTDNKMLFICSKFNNVSINGFVYINKTNTLIDYCDYFIWIMIIYIILSSVWSINIVCTWFENNIVHGRLIIIEFGERATQSHSQWKRIHAARTIARSRITINIHIIITIIIRLHRQYNNIIHIIMVDVYSIMLDTIYVNEVKHVHH